MDAFGPLEALTQSILCLVDREKQILRDLTIFMSYTGPVHVLRDISLFHTYKNGAMSFLV